MSLQWQAFVVVAGFLLAVAGAALALQQLFAWGEGRRGVLSNRWSGLRRRAGAVVGRVRRSALVESYVMAEVTAQAQRICEGIPDYMWDRFAVDPFAEEFYEPAEQAEPFDTSGWLEEGMPRDGGERP